MRGETIFVLGSGPSLSKEQIERVGSRTAIAVNCSYLLAPNAQFLFFNDKTWLTPKRLADLSGFRGQIVTTARIDGQARLCTEIRNDFPPVGCGVARQGRSSGHIAVGLAVAMGAARVVMLGFDLREVDGRSHFHNEYPARDGRGSVYANECIPGFDGWNAAAKRRGATILNATPGSALKEFPMVTLDEVL